MATTKKAIKTQDFKKLRAVLAAELDAAHSRQKSPTNDPSGFMKGLQFAIDELDKVKPTAL